MVNLPIRVLKMFAVAAAEITIASLTSSIVGYNTCSINDFLLEFHVNFSKFHDNSSVLITFTLRSRVRNPDAVIEKMLKIGRPEFLNCRGGVGWWDRGELVCSTPVLQIQLG